MKEVAREERQAVEFTADPASRLWIAVCLGLGTAILVSCVLLGAGELCLSLKRAVLLSIVKTTAS